MSLVVAWDRRFAFALAATAFFTIWRKFSNLWSLFCSSAKMDGHRLSLKYLSIVGSAGAPTRLYANKIDYRCLKYAAHSSTDSCWCWETRLNWLRMLLAKARSSPRFVRRKSLNSPHVIGSSASERRFCWCHRWTIAPRRNEAAKGTRFGPLAPAVLKWSSHCWQK